MTSIAIVGGGQLGSRHLQACAAVPNCEQVYLVDPSATSREMCAERYVAVAAPNSPELNLLDGPQRLPAKLDIAIIATTADVRLDVIRAVAADREVANWLLEKVLFQRFEDYSAALTLFAGRSDGVYVNLAQRMWPFFSKLAAKGGEMVVDVSGASWGLGCNSVHNVDIAAFLGGGRTSSWAELDTVLIAGKREGFVEFSGMVESVSGAVRVRQTCFADGDAPFTITVNRPDGTSIWDVARSKVWERSAETGWAWQDRECAAPYQSQLTTQVVSGLLAGRSTALPQLAEACAVHLDILEALRDAAKRAGHDFSIALPVT